MSASEIKDLSKLCIHTITTKPWGLARAAKEYEKAGVKGITVWRETLEGRNIKESGTMLREHGLDIVSLCRGGFFPGKDMAARQKAFAVNRQAIDEAAELGAPLIVLVCGAIPGMPMDEARKQIQEGIESVLPHAEANGVKLAIEPLHPMYADDRSAINTMKQANDMCCAINSEYIGVAVDVYHLWWDSELESEIMRCGKNGHLYAFHICDWRTPTVDLLLDRGIMGEGCINIREIRGWVEKAGFTGYNEVEVFSKRLWEMDQNEVLGMVTNGYLKHS
jgi:sugar phosphate isomerase/epimerase